MSNVVVCPSVIHRSAIIAYRVSYHYIKIAVKHHVVQANVEASDAGEELSNIVYRFLKSCQRDSLVIQNVLKSVDHLMIVDPCDSVRITAIHKDHVALSELVDSMDNRYTGPTLVSPAPCSVYCSTILCLKAHLNS